MPTASEISDIVASVRMRGQPALPEATVAAIKAMAARGDRQVDIALYWSVSPATVNALKRNKVAAYRSVLPADQSSLPAPGPYTIVPVAVHDDALVAMLARDKLVAELRTILAKYEGSHARTPVADG